ncbi:hypothetical protein [Desulfosporosinus meridiei]|uniref:Uncharacterized protein n=1 Tax=Desulfosporosinus meridiei (strain ATCC BAA-275 / DSM 13257 / KCTC 12902 / NCIMB 13706 / S10) TaxID=768704 RepID=J7IU32_DESMD|nr:hypothetical protein [Desulfosporosinus meridiei]AFQ45342.1 hypothetical protein Desmer_3496 [Desulfosporosinus meridiei DSM 13257]
MKRNLYERLETLFFTIFIVMIFIVGTWDGIQGLVNKVHETIEVHETKEQLLLHIRQEETLLALTVKNVNDWDSEPLLPDSPELTKKMLITKTQVAQKGKGIQETRRDNLELLRTDAYKIGDTQVANNLLLFVEIAIEETAITLNDYENKLHDLRYLQENLYDTSSNDESVLKHLCNRVKYTSSEDYTNAKKVLSNTLQRRFNNVDISQEIHDILATSNF